MRLSVREAIELCGIGDEDAVLCRRVRRPSLKQFEQVSGIGHLALDARMRPVAAPHQPFRISPYQRFMKWPRVGVIRRVAADAVGTGQLGPPPAVTERAQQALEAFRSSAGAGV